MVQAVQMFRTSDDTVFESQDDANIHESSIKNKQAIEAFLDKHFPKPPAPPSGEKPKQNNARGYAKKAIALWLAESDAPAPEAGE